MRDVDVPLGDAPVVHDAITVQYTQLGNESGFKVHVSPSRCGTDLANEVERRHVSDQHIASTDPPIFHPTVEVSILI